MLPSARDSVNNVNCVFQVRANFVAGAKASPDGV